MSRFDEVVDLYFTDSGDFFLGQNGDLEDTKNYHYRGFLQKVLTRLQSKRGDWKTQGNIGADLGAFVGRPNNEFVAADIKTTIIAELSQDDLLRGSEFTVDVFPVGNHQLGIALVITPPRSGGQIVLTLTYDMRDNRLIPRNI